MTHAQKPDSVFRRNGRVHLNRRGASVQSNTGSGGVRIGGSNAGYTMFRGSVKGTGYPLRLSVSPSLPLPASPFAIPFQLDSTFVLVKLRSTFHNSFGDYSQLKCMTITLVAAIFPAFSAV
jgi:hypothetical protein